MKKMSVTTTLALLLVLILGSTVAYAALNWCPDDPVFSIGGTTVNVIVEIPEESVPLVNGPVRVVVLVPRNVEAHLIEAGDGFGHGEQVRILRIGRPVGPGDDIKVGVGVLVRGAGRFPVRVTVEAPGVSKTKEGQSNKWVKCKVKL